MVPSYSGRLCMAAPFEGFFHSLVPVASPTKLATVTGALSGKSVQLMSPAVVWKVASIGCLAGIAALPGAAVLVAAGFAAVDFWVVVPVCAEAKLIKVKTRIA